MSKAKNRGDSQSAKYERAMRETNAARAKEVCTKDGKPCYVGAGTMDAHWRCGTTQCGSA